MQISKFSERPWIVPYEVLEGLHVVTRALLVEQKETVLIQYLAMFEKYVIPVF